MTYRYVWHGTLTWLLHGCICHIHMWMWHVDVAYPDESSLMCDWVMSTFTSGHDSIESCPHSHLDMTQSKMRLDSSLCVWDLAHVCVCHDFCTRVPWLIHVGDTTCAYVYHMIGVTWIIALRDTTHSYVRRDVFTRVTWLMSISYCPASIHQNFKFRV